MKNTEILKRKGMDDEQISELEAICLNPELVMIKEGVSVELASHLAPILDEVYKKKRRAHAISPIEGRYDKKIESMHNTTSGYGWTKYRVMVEIEYLIAMNKELHTNYQGEKKQIMNRLFTKEEKERLRELWLNFNDTDYEKIEFLDGIIHHDIVAMTTWITYELGDDIGDMKDEVEAALHFSRTSNDINQNVYNFIVRKIIKDNYIPAIVELQETLISKAHSPGDNVVFAGQTHGQFAEYTTFKKIFANFVHAIDISVSEFLNPENTSIMLPGKLAGAVGNDSDLIAAYPDHDWRDFNKRFIEGTLELEYVEMADQPEFNIHNQELYDRIQRTNNSIIKLCQDFWDYCSRGLFKQKSKKGESGSSVMAQKANPWRSEGGEEISYQANDNFKGYERQMRYRMQGDLRRSIQMRAIGVPFAQTIIGIKRVIEEMNKYEPNLEAISHEVESHPEMTSAAIQTILRREGIADAYDTLKAMTKGRPITNQDYETFIGGLREQGTINEEVTSELITVLLPKNNIGYAEELADDYLLQATNTANDLKKEYEIGAIKVGNVVVGYDWEQKEEK